MRVIRSVMMGTTLLGAACAGDSGAQSGAGAALRSEDGTLTYGDVVLECPQGPTGEVHVEFECDAITVYSCKDLSNVVVEYEDGERARFEGLHGQVDSFGGDGDRIVRVWVKAGANASGDGPGYGERFEAPEDSCDPPGEGGGGSGGSGDPLDPCEDADPDTWCGEGEPGDGPGEGEPGEGEPGEGEPGEGEPGEGEGEPGEGEGEPGEGEPGEDNGGDPETCLEDSNDPACQVQ